jgi:hypothetical protein
MHLTSLFSCSSCITIKWTNIHLFRRSFVARKAVNFLCSSFIYLVTMFMHIWMLAPLWSVICLANSHVSRNYSALLLSVWFDQIFSFFVKTLTLFRIIIFLSLPENLFWAHCVEKIYMLNSLVEVAKQSYWWVVQIRIPCSKSTSLLWLSDKEI